MAEISIIIPCYNRVNTICTAIDSVLNQSINCNLEIIVSDDGSTDGTIELLTKTYNSTVTIIRKPGHCLSHGAAAARNRGLRAATGKYISFLDSDDYFEPDFLSVLYDELRSDTNLGYAFCRVNSLRKSNEASNFSPWTKKRLHYIDKKYHVLNSAHVICTICQLIRKDVLDKVGYFEESLSSGEDSDMWIRISENSKGKFVDYNGAVYCINGFSDNQLSYTETHIKKQNSVAVYIRALERYITNNGQDRMRLFIIVKNLILLSLTSKNGLLYSIYRNAVVYSRLLLAMPITTIRYVVLNKML